MIFVYRVRFAHGPPMEARGSGPIRAFLDSEPCQDQLATQLAQHLVGRVRATHGQHTVLAPAQIGVLLPSYLGTTLDLSKQEDLDRACARETRLRLHRLWTVLEARTGLAHAQQLDTLLGHLSPVGATLDQLGFVCDGHGAFVERALDELVPCRACGRPYCPVCGVTRCPCGAKVQPLSSA